MTKEFLEEPDFCSHNNNNKKLMLMHQSTFFLTHKRLFRPWWIVLRMKLVMYSSIRLVEQVSPNNVYRLSSQSVCVYEELLGKSTHDHVSQCIELLWGQIFQWSSRRQQLFKPYSTIGNDEGITTEPRSVSFSHTQQKQQEDRVWNNYYTTMIPPSKKDCDTVMRRRYRKCSSSSCRPAAHFVFATVLGVRSKEDSIHGSEIWVFQSWSFGDWSGATLLLLPCARLISYRPNQSIIPPWLYLLVQVHSPPRNTHVDGHY